MIHNMPIYIQKPILNGVAVSSSLKNPSVWPEEVSGTFIAWKTRIIYLYKKNKMKECMGYSMDMADMEQWFHKMLLVNSFKNIKDMWEGHQGI